MSVNLFVGSKVEIFIGEKTLPPIFLKCSSFNYRKSREAWKLSSSSHSISLTLLEYSGALILLTGNFGFDLKVLQRQQAATCCRNRWGALLKHGDYFISLGLELLSILISQGGVLSGRIVQEYGRGGMPQPNQPLEKLDRFHLCCSLIPVKAKAYRLPVCCHRHVAFVFMQLWAKRKSQPVFRVGMLVLWSLGLVRFVYGCCLAFVKPLMSSQLSVQKLLAEPHAPRVCDFSKVILWESQGDWWSWTTQANYTFSKGNLS